MTVIDDDAGVVGLKSQAAAGLEFSRNGFDINTEFPLGAQVALGFVFKPVIVHDVIGVSAVT